MKKMRFRKRGLVALTMAAVLTFGVATPVWGTDVTITEEPNTDRDGYNNNTGDNASNSDTVVVHVNVPSEFTVSIPKETKLKIKGTGGYSTDQDVPESGAGSAVRYEAEKLRIEIPVKMSGSLGTDETVTITADDFYLKNKNGLGTNNKTHKLTVTPNNAETATNTSKYTKKDKGFTIEGAESNNGAYWSSLSKVGTWNVTNYDTIGAGHWAGPMVFTIKVEAEEDLR